LTHVIGVLVVFIALGVLVVNVIGEGLVIVVSKYGCVIIIVALGKKLFVAIVTNSIFVVVVGNVPLLLAHFDGSWVMFVLFYHSICRPKQTNRTPPFTPPWPPIVSIIPSISDSAY
jgi:hypothetical protein